MSLAILRQALDLVDPEENKTKSKKRRVNNTKQQVIGQADTRPNKKLRKKQRQKLLKKQETAKVEENIKKLLALSAPTADKQTAEKIVERAIKGKPLAEKIEVKVDDGKSILFPEESFKDFEKSYFCS